MSHPRSRSLLSRSLRCATVTGDPIAPATRAQLELITVTAVPAEEVALADEKGKWETTSNFIVHDDNTATPSQPCPPSFAVLPYNGAAPAADPADPGK